MHSFSSGHHTTIHGGTGGPGGPGILGGVGGTGGMGEGPQFTLSGAKNWNVMVQGDLINHFPLPGNLDSQEYRNQLLGPVKKDRKLCPLPVSSFTGRKDILQKMCHYFDSDRGSVQHIFVLHGLGGSGKSQLAFKFVHDSQAQAIHCFSEIFYIDATNEQVLEIDLQTITPVEVGNSAEASLCWLAGKQEEWLLFFDNADDTKLDLSKFFPHCTFGNILITTRNQELCLHTRDDEAVSRVSDMEAEDAKDLLLQLANQGRDAEQEKQAMDIVKELQCFPLAVSHAGGYIRVRSKLSRYLKLYQSHRDKLLQRAEIQGQDHYGRAVYTTWNLSYDKLSAPAQTLLQICSILHHKGISEQIFENAATSQQDLNGSDLMEEVTKLLTDVGMRDGDWDSFLFHEVIGELESYSLMEQDRQADAYIIHPLVQHWSCTTMGTNKHLMQKCVFTIIGLAISWEEKDYRYHHKLLLHAVRSATSVDLKEISTFIAAAIGKLYWEGGLWNNAEALHLVVMEKRKRELGEEHSDTLRSMANLARTYRNLGRWNDAETLEVVVMEKRKQLLGEEHPHTLRSMVNLSATYRELSRWTDAETLEVAVMEKTKHVLGEDHLDTLTGMSNLAATYSDMGRWKDAEALKVVVMEKTKSVLGEDHPNTLRSMGNLAATYGNLGRWTDAEALEVVVMEKRKTMLGEDHPDTLWSMANLATTYGDLGHWTDAEVLEVVVMEKRKTVLGENHPDTLWSMANLATTYGNLGRWTDAEVLEVVVMEKMKTVLGEEHPDTLSSMGNLAATYGKLGRWNDAEALQVVVMEKAKSVLGEDHPDTLTSMANLAVTYGNLGRLNEAEGLQVLLIEKRKCVLGEEHPDTLSSIATLVTIYQKLGR
ncbi:P-loop containing nucleoside triphosphate hydrolase protein [Mycena galericulata]|nr:P-loop containing nucleoside triphosphate hydrolase protein [Mycena galericulata]